MQYKNILRQLYRKIKIKHDVSIEYWIEEDQTNSK